MAIVAIVILGAGKDRIRDLSEGAFQHYRLAAEASEATAGAHTSLMRALSVAANESDKKRIAIQLKTVFEAMDAAQARLDALRLFLGANDASIEKITASFTAYRDATKQVLDVVADDPASASMIVADAEAAFAALVSQLRELKSNADAAQATTSRAAIDAASDAIWLFPLIVIGAALVSIVAALMISRAIARPIKQLTRDMEALAAGRTELAIAATDQRDEIGSMARAVEVFKQNAVDTRRLDAEQMAEQIRKEQRQAAIETQISCFERGVRASLDGLASAATAKAWSRLAVPTTRSAALPRRHRKSAMWSR